MCCGCGKMQIGNDLWRARLNRYAPGALRRHTQLQQLTVRAERNWPQRKDLICAADPVNRAWDFFRRSVQCRLVRRKQQPTVLWKPLEELHLFLRDAFAVSKSCDMGKANVGENAVVGPRDFFQSRHFSGSRDSDF